MNRIYQGRVTRVKLLASAREMELTERYAAESAKALAEKNPGEEADKAQTRGESGLIGALLVRAKSR